MEAKLLSAEEMSRTNWNPFRAHALRRAFGDALRAAGADYAAIEYFIGHRTPMHGAYLGNIDQAYIKAMDNLSIFGSSNEVTNLKIATLSAEVDGLKTQCRKCKDSPKQLSLCLGIISTTMRSLTRSATQRKPR